MIKKYFTDSLVQIAIVLSLLRTDLNNYLNSELNDYPEIQDIILGPTSGITQTHFHHNQWMNSINGYGFAHPKNIDNYYATTNILQELQSLYPNPYQHIHTDISAWLVSGPAPVLPADTADPPGPSPGNEQEPANNNGDNNSTESVGALDISGDASVNVEGAVAPEDETSFSEPILPIGDELTKEDLDLIDILWRQDMDLGVGREMFDSNLRKELEKERELELEKQKAQEKLEEEKKHEEEEKADEGEIQYVLDGETGEWVPAPPGEGNSSSSATTSPSQAQESQPSPQLEDNEGLSIEDAMRLLEQEPSVGFLNNSSQTTQLNATQVEQELQAIIHNTQNSSVQQLGFERQDSFERSWQDVATMLNLPPVNTSATPVMHNFTSPTLPEHPTPLIQNATLPPPVNDVASLSQVLGMLPQTQVQTLNDSINQLMQSSQANMNITAGNTVNSSFQFPASVMPPNTTSENNNLFDLDTNDLLFPNVSAAAGMVPADNCSNLLKELMEDDDNLEEMEFTNTSVSNSLQTVRMMDDASSDSAVSSMESISSPSQDLNDSHSTYSEGSLPYDGLEGATGGSEYDSMNTKHSVKQEYGYSEFTYQPTDLHVNQSSSSNDSDSGYAPADMRHVNHNHSYPLQPGQVSRESRRQSEEDKRQAARDRAQKTRDEKRAKALKVPFTVDDIVNSPVERFNDLLQKYKLNDAQLQLIRDIRRRGKNKVAAQNCRKRKLEVITTLEDEVAELAKQRDKLMAKRSSMAKERSGMKDKLKALYQEVFSSLRDEHGHPYDPSQFSLQQTADGNVFLVPHNSTSNPEKADKMANKKRKEKK